EPDGTAHGFADSAAYGKSKTGAWLLARTGVQTYEVAENVVLSLHPDSGAGVHDVDAQRVLGVLHLYPNAAFCRELDSVAQQVADDLLYSLPVSFHGRRKVASLERQG